MVYLEYHKQTKQVVEIHNTIPSVADDYDYAKSEQFEVGDELELTIWVNEVDENKNITSYSAIRNNPNARRLLQENVLLNAKTLQQDEQLAEKDKQILELKEKLFLTNEAVDQNSLAQQDLLEFLIETGVI